MAINKKGSRNINVDGHDFKWRATGNDGWISVVVWPVSNENSKVVADVEYYNETMQLGDNKLLSHSQIVVTNRMIRELILHVGILNILNNTGQINAGSIEKFYDIRNAVRTRMG